MSRETGEFKRKHLLTQTQYRSSSQIGDVLSFIVSKKKRSNKNKKKRGLFSRMFGSASDSKKSEEKEKIRKDSSALSIPRASMGPQSSGLGSEKHSLRRHDSSFRNERSVLLGKPTSKFDHYSQKFTVD